MKKFSYKKYKHIKEEPTWVYFKGVPVIENVRMENFCICQKENVVFKNCIFVNGKDNGLCLAETGAAFYNCIFAFNKGCGIYLCENAHDFKFYDCVFANNEESGAYLNNSKDNYFYNCVFEDNKDRGVSLHGKMNMFRTCVFQDNIVGVKSLKKNSSEFFECRILDNKKKGVLTSDSLSPKLKSTEIQGGEYGVCSKEHSSPCLESCMISWQSSIGVHVKDKSFIFIENCTVTKQMRFGVLFDDDSEGRIYRTKVFNQIPDSANKVLATINIALCKNSKLIFEKSEMYSTVKNCINACVCLGNNAFARVNECNMHNNEIAIEASDKSKCVCSWCYFYKNNAIYDEKSSSSVDFKNCTFK